MANHIVKCTRSNRANVNIKYLEDRGYAIDDVKPVGKSETNFWCNEVKTTDQFISVVL